MHKFSSLLDNKWFHFASLQLAAPFQPVLVPSQESEYRLGHDLRTAEVDVVGPRHCPVLVQGVPRVHLQHCAVQLLGVVPRT